MPHQTWSNKAHTWNYIGNAWDTLKALLSLSHLSPLALPFPSPLDFTLPKLMFVIWLILLLILCSLQILAAPSAHQGQWIWKWPNAFLLFIGNSPTLAKAFWYFDDPSLETCAIDWKRPRVQWAQEDSIWWKLPSSILTSSTLKMPVGMTGASPPIWPGKTTNALLTESGHHLKFA